MSGTLLLLARLFRRILQFLSARLDRFFPRRISNLLGVLTAVALFWGILDRVFITWTLRVADSVSQQVDSTIAPDMVRPVDSARTGSATSLIDWQHLGHAGRQFVTSGPTADDLATFHGGDMPTPLRVYVALNAAAGLCDFNCRGTRGLRLLATNGARASRSPADAPRDRRRPRPVHGDGRHVDQCGLSGNESPAEPGALSSLAPQKGLYATREEKRGPFVPFCPIERMPMQGMAIRRIRTLGIAQKMTAANVKPVLPRGCPSSC